MIQQAKKGDMAIVVPDPDSEGYPEYHWQLVPVHSDPHPNANYPNVPLWNGCTDRDLIHPTRSLIPYRGNPDEVKQIRRQKELVK